MTTYVNLTDREYEQLSEDIYKVVRAPRVWLDALPQRQLAGFGVKDYSWYQQYDMSAIAVSMDGLEESIGKGYLSKNTAYIPVFSKDIDIPKRDLEASRRYGQPLDTRLSMLMTAKLMAKLNEVPGLGISSPIVAYPIGQEVTDAGNTADWATMAVIEAVIMDCLITVRSSEHWGPYRAIMSAPLETNMALLIANTEATAATWARSLITDGMWGTNDIANSDGTAFGKATGSDNSFLLFAPQTEGQNNIEYLIAKEPTIEQTVGDGWSPRYKIYSAMIHEIYRTNAGAIFDAITDIGT